MLRPWSQQARQLAPRRGTVAHSRESGLLCSHSHAETIDPHGLQDQLSVFQYHPAAQLMQLVFTFTRGSYRHPWPPGSALGVPNLRGNYRHPWPYILNTRKAEKNCILSTIGLFYEYSHLEYERIYAIYRVTQAEYYIRIRMATPQEYVNTYSTRRPMTSRISSRCSNTTQPGRVAHLGNRGCCVHIHRNKETKP